MNSEKEPGPQSNYEEIKDDNKIENQTIADLWWQ